MELPAVVIASIEQALNRYLALDPESKTALAELYGKCVCIDLAGFDVQFYLVPGPAGVLVLGRFEGEPDCILRGTPLGVARLGLAAEKSDQLFDGAVEVGGDTEVAQHFGTILGNLQVDWEELLSKATGDVIAHAVGRGVRECLRWGSDARESLAADVREYVQEESRLAPTRVELEEFLGEVDQIRDDVERLSARVERLREALRQKNRRDAM